jgi:hypothetical protein
VICHTLRPTSSDLVAHELGQGVVDALPATLGVDQRHADRGVVEGQSEAGLGGPQRLLRAALLGGVGERQDAADHLARLQQRHAHVAREGRAAVRSPQGGLAHVARLAVAEGVQRRAVAGVLWAQDAGQRRADQVVRRPAEQPHRRVVHEGDRPVARQAADPLIGGLQDRLGLVL